MPNCDFYALRDDAVAVLTYIYGETDCQVYEMASRPGEDLRRFDTMADLLAAFDLGHGRASVLLQLYSPSMKGSFRIKRIDFDPARIKGPAWRFDACGWGTIQLYFGGIHENKIRPSHTNHNSEQRAVTWEPTSGGISVLLPAGTGKRLAAFLVRSTDASQSLGFRSMVAVPSCRQRGRLRTLGQF